MRQGSARGGALEVIAKRHLYALTKDVSLQARVQTTYVPRTNGRATETTHKSGRKANSSKLFTQAAPASVHHPNKQGDFRVHLLYICLLTCLCLVCSLSQTLGDPKAALADRHSNLQISTCQVPKTQSTFSTLRLLWRKCQNTRKCYQMYVSFST